MRYYGLINNATILKVKAAFTRSYNKESHMLPYSNIVIKKSRKGASAGGIEDLEDDDETLEVGEEEQEEDDVTTDAMIMVSCLLSCHS